VHVDEFLTTFVDACGHVFRLLFRPRFGSQSRGLVPIGWTLSPAMAQIAPGMVQYLYENATLTPTGKDLFIAAPSGRLYPLEYAPNNHCVLRLAGVGYAYPSRVANMTAFAETTCERSVLCLSAGWQLSVLGALQHSTCTT
jgi:hypothetical protein